MEDRNQITIDAEEQATQKAADSAKRVEDASNPQPATRASSPDVSTEAPKIKESGQKYEKFASNDSKFVLNQLDDKTTVAPGNIMESQARAPAHEQQELAVEKDAPGYEQSASLLTARHSVHYDQGGANSELNAAAGKGDLG